ncbi:unnamed protein product [Calicophoron daubneyi]|uniref:Uncharacterized protein n=1 Tax=Calicophoron daubneyi TaxID=300641 RepID=A0AAV2T3J6_CALDB
MEFYSDRISFTDYVYRKRLRELKTQIAGEPDENQFGSPSQWIRRIQLAPREPWTDSFEMTEICIELNQSLLLGQYKRSQLRTARQHLNTVHWYHLAADRDFLNGVVSLIATGLGCPNAQEASAVLLSNICTLAACDARHKTTRFGDMKIVALHTLIETVAPSLMVVLTGRSLNRLIPPIARAVEGIVGFINQEWVCNLSGEFSLVN